MKPIVDRISPSDAIPWLMSRHYARRKCPISFAFGAFVNRELVGVVTYGTPVSSSLRRGICGDVWKDQVVELNRLCCDNVPNMASALVGRSLRMLPRPLVVVSFADIEQGHVGYVYQATNFLYTGLSAKRTDWKIRGMEHLHGATVSDMSRGESNRVEFMRQKFGDAFYLQERSRKHRYVFFCGNKKEKNALRAALQYPVEEFPKGKTANPESSEMIERQNRLF